MPSSPRSPQPRQPSQPPGGPQPSQGEQLWRSTFYGFSALMAAFALVDLDAGRLAHGIGDAGVTCLLLSLMGQFPFVRAIVQAGARDASTDAREKLLRAAEQTRDASPWAERLSQAGWMLLLGSLLLRLAGVD